MTDDRGATSTLRGRLADVFVRALVDGSLAELSRRLGNRATIDDPLFGRASTLSSIEPLLAKIAAHFKAAGAKYQPVASASGVDRDVSEGLLVMNTSRGLSEVPIAVVAERRRLREIELRVYYATGAAQRKARTPLLDGAPDVAVPQIVAHVFEALRKRAVERVLAAFEDSSRFVDPTGKAFAKRDGSMASLVSELSRMDLAPAAAADDGRHCFVEAVVTRERPPKNPEAAGMTFERGDSGLLRELRLYYEP